MKSAILFLVVAIGCGLLVGTAAAQTVTTPTTPTTPAQPDPTTPTLPGGVVTLPGQLPSLQNLTPQQNKQLQTMMMLRALQMSGHHQVKTGFPQILGGGSPSLDSGMATAPADVSAGDSGTHKASSQKRAEARLLREQQKLAHTQKAKTTKTVKPPKEKPAKASSTHKKSSEQSQPLTPS